MGRHREYDSIRSNSSDQERFSEVFDSSDLGAWDVEKTTAEGVPSPAAELLDANSTAMAGIGGLLLVSIPVLLPAAVRMLPFLHFSLTATPCFSLLTGSLLL